MGPTLPSAIRALSIKPFFSSSVTATVAVGRSWTQNRMYDPTVPNVCLGTVIAVNTSCSSFAVSSNPTKNLSTDTVRVPLTPDSSSDAPHANNTVAGSLCGSAKHKLPPIVPATRTRKFPIQVAASDSSGTCSRTNAACSSCRCVTNAPMRSLSSSTSRVI